VERDHALVVRRALGGEVDDDAGFLPRMHAHDAADPLLVHAAARGRREVHDDRRPRGVPPLGEQHCVDEHVDLAALVRRERLRQLHGRRPAADGLRLQPGGAELLREVVRVLDACRIDDAGRRVEAVSVQGRGGLVERLVVEDFRQLAFVEVAADDRHRMDRRGRRDA